MGEGCPMQGAGEIRRSSKRAGGDPPIAPSHSPDVHLMHLIDYRLYR
jgi:hypothetical protein